MSRVAFPWRRNKIQHSTGPVGTRVAAPGGRRTSRGRLRLEPLEDRTLPAVYFASPVVSPFAPIQQLDTPAEVFADFDGDGLLDGALADKGGNRVHVFLDRGGIFAEAPGSPIPVGPNPGALTAADFNGDGKPDLAVVNRTDRSLSVLLGHGDGMFSTAPITPMLTGVDLVDLAVADVNGDGDGKMDLVAADPADASVRVFPGKGDGTFGAAVETGLGFQDQLLTLGDLNGDGKPDLVAASQAEKVVKVFLGNGDGSFGAAVGTPVPSTGSVRGSWAPLLVDFNGDGRLDLAVMNQGDSTNLAGSLDVFLGNGDGTFKEVPGSSPLVVGPQPVSAAAGDFNGDGKPDLAAANLNGNVSVLLGNGAGSFRPAANYLVGFQPKSLWAGEATGDGKPDLVVAGSDRVGVLPGNGDGTFRVPRGFGASGDSLAVVTADFNNDGNPDVAEAIRSSFQTNYNNVVNVLLSDGKGNFTEAPGSPVAVGPDPEALAAGDLNGDGRTDLVVANTNPRDVGQGLVGTLSVLLGNGDGTFRQAAGSPVPVGRQPVSVALGDFNGDGRPDLLVALEGDLGAGNSGVRVRLGNGDGTFAAGPDAPLPADRQPHTVVVADFNGDGRADFASVISSATSSPTLDLSVFLGHGDGTFTTASDFPLPTGNYPGALVAADFNGDGKPDLVTGNSTLTSTGSANITVVLGRGDGTFSPVPGPSFPVTSLAAADFNRDGRLDLAMASDAAVVTHGSAGVFSGNGDGTFEGPDLFPGGAAPALAAADVNRDGLPDLVLAGFDHVWVLLDTPAGLPTLAATPNPAPFGQPVTLTVIVSPSVAGLGTPTGTVTFTEGTTTLGTATVDAAGRASLTVATFPLGGHTITARYSGGGAFQGGSTSAAVTVNAGPTTIVLSSSPNPAPVGQPVTFTVAVQPAPGVTGVPTGKVNLLDHTTVLGSADLDASGVASLTITSLGAGSYTLTAAYTGDPDFQGSTSAPLTQVVGGPPTGHRSTVGVYDPSMAIWYLRNENSAGPADFGTFAFGAPGLIPLAGDYIIPDGREGIGLYNPATGTWLLTDAGQAYPAFQFGFGGLPVTIDFNGDGKDGIALYNSGTWTVGDDTVVSFTYGLPGMIPVAGDFDGDGKDGIGLFNPFDGTWYLTDGGQAYPPVQFGGAFWKPVVGDWDGSGRDSIGVFDPTTATWFLRDSVAPGSVGFRQFQYGAPGWLPVAGDWNGKEAQAELAAALPRPGAAPAGALAAADLAWARDAALARLTPAGLDATGLDRLRAVAVVLADLPGRELGLETGNIIFIDRDAAGYGWFADPTPLRDEEFAGPGPLVAPSGSPAAGRMDLLTVLEHEYGHALGLPDRDAGHGDDAMAGTLAPGVRRLFTADALSADPTA